MEVTVSLATEKAEAVLASFTLSTKQEKED
jgi:hypothetical protein